MRVSLRQARQQLSKLMTAVEQGAEVEILRRGRVVARLEPAGDQRAGSAERKQARSSLREKLPPASTEAPALVRELRNERG